MHSPWRHRANRTSPRFIPSALACVQIYFSLAEYDKADQFLQEVLKRTPKSQEALYWQGLIAFYTYRSESLKDSARKTVAVRAETVLLRTNLCA